MKEQFNRKEQSLSFNVTQFLIQWKQIMLAVSSMGHYARGTVIYFEEFSLSNSEIAEIFKKMKTFHLF